MDRIGKVLMVLSLTASAGTAPARAQDAEATAAQCKAQYEAQYQALQREFQQTARGLYEATTDQQRSAVAEHMAALSVRVLDWAEQHADAAPALDSLVQVVVQEIWLENNTAHAGRPGASLEDRAIALLLQHHLRSATLGEACTHMSYGFRRQCETLLRAVLASSPHHDVQGLACLRLAQILNARLRRLELLGVKPEMAARYEGLFGADYLGELQRQDRTAALAEIEALFERAAREFGDTKLPYDLTVGGTARSELHELRHLSVGKQALELEGPDEDGETIRLSDQRGKVVLLYFWSEH